jgi:hypothetical protein
MLGHNGKYQAEIIGIRKELLRRMFGPTQKADGEWRLKNK